MSIIAWTAGLVGIALLLLASKGALSAWRRYRGRRLVTCPETGACAAVETDAVHAGLTAIRGPLELRLKDCSRWPEKQGCGQECLAEIEKGPAGCLVRTIVADWFRDKTCAFCGKGFHEIAWHDHRPALVGLDGATVPWYALRPETLPQVLATHAPVCWDCHMVESVIREHPDMVTVRPGRSMLVH